MPDHEACADSNLQEYACRLRAAAVCIREGRVLLVRHEHPRAAGPYWVPPGGGVLSGESLRAAALRELKEETGCEGEAVGVLGFREVLKPEGMVFEVFLEVALKGQCAPERLECPAGDVLKEARWFTEEALGEVQVYPEALADWLRDSQRHTIPLDRLCMAPVVIRGR